MRSSINLLLLNYVQDRENNKLTKGKDIYQLQNIDGETYRLSPFNMLVYKGKFNEYLSENRITLCYIIDDYEIEHMKVFNGSIRTYDVFEDGTLKIHQNHRKYKK